jgi:hypothetical protein
MGAAVLAPSARVLPGLPWSKPEGSEGVRPDLINSPGYCGCTLLLVAAVTTVYEQVIDGFGGSPDGTVRG